MADTSVLSLIDVALATAALVAAGLAMFTSTRKAQVMGFVALGVVMTGVWLRLGSVDVAFAEAALGTGVLSAILARLALRHTDSGQRGITTTIITVLAGAALGAVLVHVWWRAGHVEPAWAEGVEPIAGVEHEVTAVLLAFRAYDTLLESAVLMLAGVVVLTQMPRVSEATEKPRLLRSFVLFIAPVLLLIGLWLLFAGSSRPGGAFQSGAVLAALLILLHIAQVAAPPHGEAILRIVLAAGVVVFVLSGLVMDGGLVFGVILAVEVTLTAGIAAGLFLLYLGLSGLSGRREVPA